MMLSHITSLPTSINLSYSLVPLEMVSPSFVHPLVLATNSNYRQYWLKLFHQIKSSSNSSEYVVEHVLREAHKICIAMSVTLGKAAVQKSAEDTLIGTELVQKML